jgi:hypothetical protein
MPGSWCRIFYPRRYSRRRQNQIFQRPIPAKALFRDLQPPFLELQEGREGRSASQRRDCGLVSQVPQTRDARVVSVEDLLINFLGIGEAEKLFLRPALCNHAQGCRILDLSTPFGAAALSAAVTLSSV